MHIDYQPEILHRHLRKCLIAQQAGVVDEDIDPTPAFHGCGNHCVNLVLIGDIGADRQRLAASCGDFVGDIRRIRFIQFVDDDFGAARRQCQRMSTAQAAARAGNDGYLAVETNSHELLFSSIA